MSKNMVFAWAGDVLIAVHGTQAPTDEEWSNYLKTIRKVENLQEVRSLAFTDGGAPNSLQRKEINDLLKGRPGLGAVVSASTLVRSVVTAMTWFNPLMKAFPPERVDEAYAHLKLKPAEIDAVRREIANLRKAFGAPLQCVGL
jgi:hypothetical protein